MDDEKFNQLDKDIRELLELIHAMKIDYIAGRKERRLDYALFLVQKIQAEIYELFK